MKKFHLQPRYFLLVILMLAIANCSKDRPSDIITNTNAENSTTTIDSLVTDSVATDATDTPTDSSTVMPVDSIDLDVVSVISMDIETRTSNSLILRTVLSEGYPFQMSWGLTAETASQNLLPAEMSSIYGPAPGHKTTITDLPPDTEIYLQTNDPSSENRLEVRVFTFRTAPMTEGPVVPVDFGDPLSIKPWPSNANGNLPYAGLFLGNAYSNQIGGNTTSGSEIAVRFRAQRTGYIDVIKVPDRSITQNDLDTRPAPYSTVKATGANLEEASWMLPNSYVVGKPILTPEIRTMGSNIDDPESGSVIGSGTVPLIPSNFGAPEIPLSSPVAVTAGQIYWVIWRNSQPILPGTKINGNTLEEAREPARRTMGAMSFNGSQQTVTVSSSDVAWGGPWRASHSKVAVKKYSNSAWSLLGEPINNGRNILADMSIKYTDGVWTGKAYSGFATDQLDGNGGTRVLATNHVARQKIHNPANSSFTSNGIWVYFGYRGAGSDPDGSSISVQAKDVNTGTVLASGAVPYDETLKQVIYDGLAGSVSRPSAATRAKMWKWVPWSSLVTVPANGDVYIELTATTASQTNVVALNPLDYGKYAYESIDVYNPERAQFSKNNGASWENWSSQYREKQLLILLTKEGEIRNF